MIAYLRGTLTEIAGPQVVVEVQGVGYAVFVPISLLEKLPAVGKEVRLHTWLHSTDTSIELFGFFEPSDREFFLTLISLSSIGPRSALKMLSKVSPGQFRLAIAERSLAKLTAIPGIGKKTAQRIILELGGTPAEAGEVGTETENQLYRDAVGALVVLGYSKSQARRATDKALGHLGNKKADLTALVKEALQHV